MVGISHDDVIENFDFQELTSSNEVTGDFDVSFGRSWLAARMIVLCEAPSYVQSPIGGTDVNAGSTTKGVLCLRANHSNGLTRTRPFAR
jgi:hypothetical protein